MSLARPQRECEKIRVIESGGHVGKRSEQIRRDRQRVLAFRNGLVEVLNRSQPVDEYLGQMCWEPRPGMEQEVAQRSAELERLTQPAAQVVQNCGVYVDFSPAGTSQSYPVNPIPAWSSLFDRPLIDASLIVSSCDRAIGALDAAIEDAEAHEGTAAGRIEYRLDGPRGIWRAIRGAPRDARAHQSVFWSGVVVTVIGGVIVAGIAHWLGWV